MVKWRDNMNFRNNALWNGFLDRRDMEPFRADIYETETEECIEMDLPGYTKENITIDYNNGYLTVTAVNELDEKNYIHQERFYGEYSRSFYVGDIDETTVKATFQNGILKLTFPKEKSTPSIRRITIE